MMRIIYLDHNATTPIRSEVQQAIRESLDLYGNASSVHPRGFEARDAIEKARKELIDFFGVTEGRIIFTSGGSESNNLVIKGIVCEGAVCPRVAHHVNRPHVITTAVEHPSVLNTTSCLHRIGADITTVGVDSSGRVDPDDVVRAIRPTTVLVSIMMANNEVGTIQPVAEIGKIVKEKGIALHTDAVQAVGKLQVSVDDLQVDYMSMSGHKINAPKGIGALYIRRTMSLCPLIHGGHQELNLRAGTENNLGIIALGKAIQLARENMDTEVSEIRRLRDLLYKLLVAHLDGVSLNGTLENSLPGTLNLSFDRVDGAAVLELMAAHGICASTGSACSSGEENPSHVLTAMHIPPEKSRSAIRFSLGYGNTEEEIRIAAETIVEIVKRLRAYSPLK